MWAQLIIRTPQAEVDALCEVLVEAGAQAVTCADAGDVPVYEPEPGTGATWPITDVTALFDRSVDLQAVLQFLSEHWGHSSLSTAISSELANRTWETAWQDHFKPMRFGERLWICPSWATPPDPNGINIRLDPGLAFGTGTHPTTAMCLHWLDAHPPQDQVVMDYGCGSGILALAALKLGASRVYAIDHEPQALVATQQNIENNAIAQAQLHTALPKDCPTVRADLLMANILANPLHTLAPRFKDYLKPGGRLVLSGILAAQSADLQQRYTDLGFAPCEVTEEDGWVCLASTLNTH